jgi:N-acetylmuramic acid 6-phosphate etherase
MNIITEQSSHYRYLEKMSIAEITACINDEDQKVALAIKEKLFQINNLITVITGMLRNGGRLFYVGAGAGGRLAVLDALELPTTYGIKKGMVNVILAGGLENLVHAPEDREDDTSAGWLALQDFDISVKDIVVGVSASGATPFVLAALRNCRQASINTGCIVSNPYSPLAMMADYPVEVITGPEFVTGSTRMKCGSTQKMILDMISTTIMIQLGKVDDNSMIDVMPVNNKIMDRSVKILMNKTGINKYEQAKELLLKYGSIREAMTAFS